MDEAGIKSIIADRLLASLDKPAEAKKPEAAEMNPVVSASISDDGDETSTDFRAIMDSYFGK